MRINGKVIRTDLTSAEERSISSKPCRKNMPDKARAMAKITIREALQEVFMADEEKRVVNVVKITTTLETLEFHTDAEIGVIIYRFSREFRELALFSMFSDVFYEAFVKQIESFFGEKTLVDSNPIPEWIWNGPFEVTR